MRERLIQNKLLGRTRAVGLEILGRVFDWARRQCIELPQDKVVDKLTAVIH
jgi:hypothetical protein